MSFQDYKHTLDQIAGMYPNAKPRGEGWRMPCPAHGGDDANLEVWPEEDRVGAKCYSHHCDYKDIMNALGIVQERGPQDAPKKRPTRKPKPPKTTDKPKTYTGNPANIQARYKHPDGTDRLVVRYDFDPGECWFDDCKKKDTKHKHVFNYGKKDGTELLLWTDDDPDKQLLIVEGEKCAKTVAKANPKDYVPVSYFGGSGSAHLSDYSVCEGRVVTVWPDGDEGGMAAASDVIKMAAIAGAREVKLVDVSGLDEKEDVADLLVRKGGGKTVGQLLKNAAPQHIPRDPETGKCTWSMSGPKLNLGGVSLKTVQNRQSQLRTTLLNWAHERGLPSFLRFDDPFQNAVDRIIHYLPERFLIVGNDMYMPRGSVWREMSFKDLHTVTAVRQLHDEALEMALNDLAHMDGITDETLDQYRQNIAPRGDYSRLVTSLVFSLKTQADKIKQIPPTEFNDRNRHPIVPFTNGKARDLRTGKTITAEQALPMYIKDLDWEIPEPSRQNKADGFEFMDVIESQYGMGTIKRLSTYLLGTHKRHDVLRMPSNSGKTTLYDMLNKAFPGAFFKRNAKSALVEAGQRFTPLTEPLSRGVCLMLDEATHQEAEFKASQLNALDSDELEWERKGRDRITVRRTANILIMGAEQWPNVDSDAQGFESRFRWVMDRIDVDRMTGEQRALLLSDESIERLRYGMMNFAHDMISEHGSITAIMEIQENVDERKADLEEFKRVRANPVYAAIRELLEPCKLPGTFASTEEINARLSEHDNVDKVPSKNNLPTEIKNALNIKTLTRVKGSKNDEGKRPWGYREIRFRGMPNNDE